MRCNTCGMNRYEHSRLCPQCGAPFPGPPSALKALESFEQILLAVFLGLMILLVLVQIVMRNFLASGFIGGADIVRHLVLWVAFLGAGVAARDGRHIRIDALPRFMSPRTRCGVEVLTGMFSVVVCVILVHASMGFVMMDYRFGTTIAFLDMPVWVLASIIPLGYGVVATRFAVTTVRSIIWYVNGRGEA